MVTRSAAHALGAKLTHFAHLINAAGEVSALCFARPRRINLRQASWTIRAEAVTCPGCLTRLRAQPTLTPVPWPRTRSAPSSKEL